MTAEQLEELLGKVTQGEWETDVHIHDAPYQSINIGPKGDYRCAKVWQDDCAHDCNPEQRANATLIALAPSLARRVLAAEKLVEALDNLIFSQDHRALPWGSEHWHNARTALAAYREALQ